MTKLPLSEGTALSPSTTEISMVVERAGSTLAVVSLASVIAQTLLSPEVSKLIL